MRIWRECISRIARTGNLTMSRTIKLLSFCSNTVSTTISQWHRTKLTIPTHFTDERRLDEVNESCSRLSTLLSEVDSNISLVLASTRVRLQNLELQTAITTLALGAGTAIAGFFGMNLVSGLEESQTAFMRVTGVGIGLMCRELALSPVRRASETGFSALRGGCEPKLIPNLVACSQSSCPLDGTGSYELVDRSFS